MRALVVAAIAAVIVAPPLHAQAPLDGDRSHASQLSIDPFADRDVGPHLELSRSIRRHFAVVIGGGLRVHDTRKYSSPFVTGVDAGARYYLFDRSTFEGPFVGLHAGYRYVDERLLMGQRSARTYREAGADVGYGVRLFSRMRITPALVFDCENPTWSLHDHTWHLRPRLGLGFTF
jgi:hypothetical protein